ncbi:PLP-dependent transferase [Clostridia bacterium]|nr:PLP-dependent transferase [Clostridia bacterium]
MDMKEFEFDTKLIHGGSHELNAENALSTPIYQTSTFAFHDTDHIERVMSFESNDCVYTRGNNPTLKVFEKRMADLEDGVDAVAFSSGMAAISSVLFSLMKAGDTLVTHRTIYGSTYNLVTKILPRYDMVCKMLDMTNLAALEKELKEQTATVVYFETPCNPNLEIIDIKEVCLLAKKYGAKVVVDNTFASPYLQRPLLLGADVVIHSATKYICGHGDVIGGVAISKDLDYIMSLKFNFMSEIGGVMSPFNAWLLIRGLKTLHIRMDRHMENAKRLVDFLQSHSSVSSVLYPGLEDFPGHKIAKQQMNGFGAMIGFEVKGGLENTKKVMNSLKMTQIAVSLGDCETLIEQPAVMTHRGYDSAELEKFGLSEQLLRVSVGLESIEDIIEDFDQALSNI